MGDFRRTRSKVWWSDYFPEDNIDDKGSGDGPSSSRPVTLRFNWRQSSSSEENNRNSSSSPSNGSQKSQDSGFSDSESSSPSSCGSNLKSSKNFNVKNKSEQESPNNEICRCDNSGTKEEKSDTPFIISRLQNMPVNRIPRPYFLRNKKRDPKSIERVEQNLEKVKSKCNSISNYLADCYFPLNNFMNYDNGESPESTSVELPPSRHSLSIDDEKYLQTVLLNDSKSLQNYQRDCESSSSDIESRTCFIVDELPKKHNSTNDRTLSQCKFKTNTSRSSSETLSSITTDDLKTDTEETVKYIEKNNKCEQDELDQDKKPNLPCIDLDLLKASSVHDENHLSNLDLSHLSEPAHTSTPKKGETKIHRLPRKTKQLSKINDDNTKSDSPSTRWLQEIRYRYEPECLTILQAKSVTQCCKRKVTGLMPESINSVQIFHHKTKIITDQFSKLYEKIDFFAFSHIRTPLKNLINIIMEFILSCSQLLPRMDFTSKENLLKLMDMCDRLRQISSCHAEQKTTLINDINNLEKLFSCFTDCVLTQQVILFTSVLENYNNESDVLNALSGVTSLVSNIPRTNELISQFGGIQRLLKTCVKSESLIVRKAALRTLTEVCQNASSIRQLEKEGGIKILAELLSDSTKTENELLEIISVLIQVTAPWIEDDHVIEGLIYHLYPIINALTGLITTTNSCETLLLSAAALANISFIEPQAVYILLKLNTTEWLLTAVKKLGLKSSVFLLEQVATLIANMAAVPDTRAYLAHHRAVGALLYFLQLKHSPVQSAAEIAAAERLQHKSAIALSRLCSNPEICKQVIDLQGVSRLVRLCREERERNYSDGVLVACLASLRKITTNCGKESISQLNAKELVEPRLVDSFLLYSSRQESYV